MPAKRPRGNGHATSIVSVRGQTIIPKRLRDTCQIHEGDRIRWRLYKGGLLVERLIITPAQKADALTDREWRQLDRLVSRQRKAQQRTHYTSVEDAKGHSRKLTRHAH
ncbi:MAG: AbrB/MazE/SpoVT family DNA-binding domain-containing protein [Candidatus Omnitrophica bacterium]|nr:AbrB/MazE/SpoVT family DNA-binding domain-containing protein [Candidatus Omnitrophota bacterium]